MYLSQMVLSQQQEQRAAEQSHFLNETADLAHSVNTKEKKSKLIIMRKSKRIC